MLALNEALAAIQSFMERGGDVLYMLLFVTFILWVLIVERLWYFTLEYSNIREYAI